MLSVITIFDSDGDVQEVFRVLPNGTLPALPPRCNRKGDLAVVAQVEPPDELRNGLYRPFVTVFVGRADEPFRAVMRIPGTDSHRSERQMGPLGDFAREPLVAVSDSSVFAVTGDALEIAEFGFDGRQLRLIRVRDFPRSPVTSEDIERVRQEQLAVIPPRYHAQLERSLASLEWPEFHPIVTGLLADSNGCIWIRQATPGKPEQLWRIFSRTGRPVARVILPEGLTLTAVGARELIGFANAKLDGGQVLVYPFDHEASVTC